MYSFFFFEKRRETIVVIYKFFSEIIKVDGFNINAYSSHEDIRRRPGFKRSPNYFEGFDANIFLLNSFAKFVACSLLKVKL